MESILSIIDKVERGDKYMESCKELDSEGEAVIEITSLAIGALA